MLCYLSVSVCVSVFLQSYYSHPAWDHRHVRLPYADLTSRGRNRWSCITNELNNVRLKISDITKFNGLKVTLVTTLIVFVLFILLTEGWTLNDIALLNKSSHSYGVSLAIWDHTVLPDTRHKWTHPTLTPVRQPGTWFTYPGGMEGWVDLSGWVCTIKEQLMYIQLVKHCLYRHLTIESFVNFALSKYQSPL